MNDDRSRLPISGTSLPPPLMAYTSTHATFVPPHSILPTYQCFLPLLEGVVVSTLVDQMGCLIIDDVPIIGTIPSPSLLLPALCPPTTERCTLAMELHHRIETFEPVLISALVEFKNSRET